MIDVLPLRCGHNRKAEKRRWAWPFGAGSAHPVRSGDVLPNTDISKSGSLTVGERIELRRLQRRMSRRVVANLVGRSEEWLRLVESGRQHLESVRVMIRLAEVLRIDDLNELIDRPVPQSPDSTDSAIDLVQAFKHVILDHPPIHVYDEAAQQVETVPTVSEELRRCQQIWTESPRRYSALAEHLPPLLTTSRALSWRVQDGYAEELLVQVYHLARQLLTKAGAHSLAWTVADRAMATAWQTKHPILIAASAWHVGNALLHLEQFDECRDYATTAATNLTGWAPDSIDRELLIGALHLVAAQAAAAALDLAETERLLTLTQQAVQGLNTDQWTYGVVFGPTAIGIARIEMALRHKDFDDIVQIASEMEIADDYPVGGRARYHIAVAYAFARRREDVAATFALSRAADACPEDLRYDLNAHRALQHLIRHGNRLVSRDVARLAALADLD